MRIFLMMWIFQCFVLSSFGQLEKLKNIEPDSSNYPNIYVKKLFSDDKSTVFLIWIKKEVVAHYHQSHTEVVTIVEGKGLMTLGEKQFTIRKGDAIVIPMKTPHSVKTTSKKPLKVMSIQSPMFDGKDRILIQ